MTEDRVVDLLPLPCPFCGGEADLRVPQKGAGGSILIGCEDPTCLGWCDLSGPFATPDHALKMWNRRTVHRRVMRLQPIETQG